VPDIVPEPVKTAFGDGGGPAVVVCGKGSGELQDGSHFPVDDLHSTADIPPDRE